MIIGDGIMLGAGGETASILVTGLSETDTVTASKDGKTVTGKWTQKPNPVSHGLPDGYTELEYIESSGTQYIDTEFKPKGTTKIICDFQMVNQGTEQQGVFGSRPGESGRFTVFTGHGTHSLQVDYNTSETLAVAGNSISGLNLNNRNTIEVSNSLIINGNTIKTVSTASFTSAYNLLLFANNNVGTTQLLGTLKLYSCQIYDNGVLVRDFIPCKKVDGTVGMLDNVNSIFYGNTGTGVFTAGAEVPQTIDGFLIDKIKDYGTWTVTATNGTKTATQDVLVDSATQYAIELEYKLWLYKDGVSYDFENFHLYGTPASYGHGVSYAGKITANKVDLSKYTKIGFSCPQLSNIVTIYIPNTLDVDSVYSSGLKNFNNTLSGYADISTQTSERYVFIGASSHWDSDTMSVVDYDTYFQTKHKTDSTLVNYINEVWLE